MTREPDEFVTTEGWRYKQKTATIYELVPEQRAAYKAALREGQRSRRQKAKRTEVAQRKALREDQRARRRAAKRLLIAQQEASRAKINEARIAMLRARLEALNEGRGF